MLLRAVFAVSSSRYLIACSIAPFASAANLRAAEFLHRLSQPATALSWQVPAGNTAVFDSIDAFPVTGDQFEWYFNDTLIEARTELS